MTLERLDRWLLPLMTLAFLAGASLRLTPFSTITPDSGEYVVRARTLATLGQYRDVSRPDRSPRSLRPPGLSLLLLPAAWLSPYGVVAAKITVLLASLPLIYLFRRLAIQSAGAGPALAATAVLLTSPWLLFSATEVLSEVPYVAVVLAAICLLESADATHSWRWLAAGLLAGAAVLFRTAGWTFVLPFALVLAAGQPLRWRLAAAALALAPGALWLLRDQLTAEPRSYAWLAEEVQSSLGLSSMIGLLLSNASYYGSTMAMMWLPAAWPPDFLAHACAGGPEPRLPGTAALLLGALLWVLALVGLWAESGRRRYLLAGYAFCYMALLTLYPIKSDRLLWPLAVVLLIPQARGAAQLAKLAEHILPAPATRRILLAVFAAAVAALLIGQLPLGAPVASTAAEYWASPERFYAKYADHLPLHYRDWPSAGRYLSAQAPPYARILTPRHELFCWSKRLQQYVTLGSCSPPMLLDILSQFKPQYVVVGSSPNDPPYRTLVSNPFYLFKPVYSTRGVSIYQVEPNLAGVAPPLPSLSPVIRTLNDEARDPASSPQRRLELARLLEFDAHYPASAEVAESLARDGFHSLNLYLTLGHVLAEVGRYDEARRWLQSAALLPEAEFKPVWIRGGLSALRDYATRDNPAASPDQRVRAGLAIAMRHVNDYRFDAAVAAADAVLRIDPAHAQTLYWRGLALQYLGRQSEAMQDFNSAAAHGHKEAQRRFLLGQALHALETNTKLALDYQGQTHQVDPAIPDDHLVVADALQSEGARGRALAVLARAAQRFPTSLLVHTRLAAAYESFGLWPDADRASRRALELAPRDPSLQSQAHRIHQALTPPAIP